MIIGKSDFIYFLILLYEKTKTSGRNIPLALTEKQNVVAVMRFAYWIAVTCHRGQRNKLRIMGGSKENDKFRGGLTGLIALGREEE